LRLHRAEDSWIDPGDSRVSVDLNQKMMDEVPMEPKLKVLSRLKEWLFPGKADDRVSQVVLPGNQLSSANRLDFQFDLRAKPNADCSALEWSDRTGIDPNSSIDLTRVAHFVALPNLALFANSGFPFTRLADLADTAFIMPDAPSADEVQAYLNLMGTLADATGLPGYRDVVTTANRVDMVSGRNLIVIGLDASQPLLRQWEGNNSIRISSVTVKEISGLSWTQRLFQPLDNRAPYGQGGALGFAEANLGKPYAYMSSYWSPLNPNRIVVAIGGNDGASMVQMIRQLGDVEKADKIQGDFFLFVDGKGEFYTSGRRNFVGELPTWWKIQWLAASYGLGAFIAVICAIMLLATAIHRYAKQRVSRILGSTWAR
jgi:hypothetical protein